MNYPESKNFSFDIIPKSIIATASFKIPSPKRTEFSTGNFYALINEIAVIVSVADRMLLNIKI